MPEKTPKDKADEGHMKPVKITVSIAGHLDRKVGDMKVFCRENTDWVCEQKEFYALTSMSKVERAHILRVCLGIGARELMGRIRDYAEREGVNIDHLDGY